MHRMFNRILSLFFGLALYGVGIVMTIQANIGTSPWDMFHIGLTNYLPLTLGQVSQIVGLIIIVFCLFIGVKPGIGTVSNMFFIGLFIDLIYKYSLIPKSSSIIYSLLLMFGGIFVIGWATYFYLGAGLGAGPRDGLMLGIIYKSGWPVWKIRTIMELSVVAGGFIMDGQLGIGTAITAFTIGPSIQLVYKIMGKQAEEVEHQTIEHHWKDLIVFLKKKATESQ